MKKYSSKKYLIKQLKKNTYIEIARENEIDSSTIQRYMRKYELTKKRALWTKKEIDLLKQHYSLNSEVYRLFPDRTINSVNHKASRLRLKKILRKSLYTVNYKFFRYWTHEMAYVTGFFFSDGNVSHDMKQISIHLHQNDFLILEKINSFMESDRPIGHYPNSCYLRIDNKILAKDLIKLGCTPRKSRTLKFPRIKDEFLSHFVRGYFDGDGSISFNKPNTIKVTFFGTKEFLEEMQHRINKILKIKSNPITRVNTIYRFNYYGDDARKLCTWMYKNSKSLYLKRKRERFERHIKIRNGKIQTSNTSKG